MLAAFVTVWWWLYVLRMRLIVGFSGGTNRFNYQDGADIKLFGSNVQMANIHNNLVIFEHIFRIYVTLIFLCHSHNLLLGYCYTGSVV